MLISDMICDIWNLLQNSLRFRGGWRGQGVDWDSMNRAPRGSPASHGLLLPPRHCTPGSHYGFDLLLSAYKSNSHSTERASPSGICYFRKLLEHVPPGPHFWVFLDPSNLRKPEWGGIGRTIPACIFTR